MLLIGMFDSPFVRPVAISMKLLDIPFEHANWSVGKDFERIRRYNPLGRVPTLVLDDGEVLMETSAILDYLGERVGPERALLPRSGRDRRTALHLIAVTSGASDKAREQLYELAFRPAEKRHEPWVERCRTQMHGAWAELERHAAQERAGPWLVGGRLTLADIVVSCGFTFATQALAATFAPGSYPALRSLVARCEALPEFKSTRLDFVPPSA
jgi:glutathione S-transferase